MTWLLSLYLVTSGAFLGWQAHAFCVEWREYQREEQR